MYYYRQIIDGEITGYQTFDEPCTSPFLSEITEDEYTAAMAELSDSYDEDDVPSYEELQNRIDELEAENAALLFEILTGEVIDNV